MWQAGGVKRLGAAAFLLPFNVALLIRASRCGAVDSFLPLATRIGVASPDSDA
jgi:hypothetical protein